MFISVNVCSPVSIETYMLAADLKATALKIGYAKQQFHGPMNSRKRGLDITSKGPFNNYVSMILTSPLTARKDT